MSLIWTIDTSYPGKFNPRNRAEKYHGRGKSPYFTPSMSGGVEPLYRVTVALLRALRPDPETLTLECQNEVMWQLFEPRPNEVQYAAQIDALRRASIEVYGAPVRIAAEVFNPVQPSRVLRGLGLRPSDRKFYHHFGNGPTPQRTYSMAREVAEMVAEVYPDAECSECGLSPGTYTGTPEGARHQRELWRGLFDGGAKSAGGFVYSPRMTPSTWNDQPLPSEVVLWRADGTKLHAANEWEQNFADRSLIDSWGPYLLGPYQARAWASRHLSDTRIMISLGAGDADSFIAGRESIAAFLDHDATIFFQPSRGVSIRDLVEAHYRQWWSGGSGPPRDDDDEEDEEMLKRLMDIEDRLDDLGEALGKAAEGARRRLESKPDAVPSLVRYVRDWERAAVAVGDPSLPDPPDDQPEDDDEDEPGPQPERTAVATVYARRGSAIVFYGGGDLGVFGPATDKHTADPHGRDPDLLLAALMEYEERSGDRFPRKKAESLTALDWQAFLWFRDEMPRPRHGGGTTINRMKDGTREMHAYRPDRGSMEWKIDSLAHAREIAEREGL